MTYEKIQLNLDLMSKAADAKLAQVYYEARKNIQAELLTYYEKYADSKGILTYNEMSKYNRLKNLNDFLAEEIKSLGYEVDTTVKELVKGSYNEAYTQYGINISEQYGSSISFSQIRREDLISLINEPNVSGTSLSVTLSNNRYNALLYERQTITQGLLRGESYVKMAKRIQEATNKSFNDSLRISRTEAARAQSEGQMMAYDEAEEMGIELVKTWNARMKNTRPDHVKLHGTHPDKNGYWVIKSGDYAGAKTRYPVGFGVAALDINCFCVVEANVKRT